MYAHVDDAKLAYMGQQVQGGVSQPRKSSNPFSITLPTLSPHPLRSGSGGWCRSSFGAGVRFPTLPVSKSVSKYCARALLLC